MSLESAAFIKALIATNPEGTDPKSQGDDHLRLLKSVLQSQFAGFTDGIPITKTESQLNAALYAGPGAFGLGGAAIQILEADLISDTLPCGFYYIVNGSGGNLPGGVGAMYVLRIDLAAPGYWLNFCISADAAPNDSNIHVQTKYNGVVGQWHLFWNNFNTPKQTNLVDMTPAAILNPASFGLGHPMIAGAGADLNWGPYAKVLNAGRWLGYNWVNCPAGETSGIAVVEWIPYSQDWGQQRFKSMLSREEWVRYWYNAATWSPWIRELGAGLKVAAQNGYQDVDWIRRQWGVHTPGIAATGGTATVTFPIPFSAVWSATANCTAFAGSNIYSVNVYGLTTSNITLGYYASTASASGPIYWSAVGAV